MGEYIDDPYGLGNYIVLYYGSFREVLGDAPAEVWEEELWETMLHEIRHHVELRAGVDDLELEDLRQLKSCAAPGKPLRRSLTERMRRRTSGTRITVANGDGSPQTRAIGRSRALSVAFQHACPAYGSPGRILGRPSAKKGLVNRERVGHNYKCLRGEKTRGDTTCGRSSVGRAQPCHGWGREFESRRPLHFSLTSAAFGRVVVINVVARRHSQVAKAEVCKTSIPSSNLGAASILLVGK